MLGEVIKLTVRKKEDGRFDGELGRMRLKARTGSQKVEGNE
jgi:hypothetical protein